MQEQMASKFRIVGADRGTGEDIEIVVTAENKAAALKKAQARNILVCECAPIGNPMTSGFAATATPKVVTQGADAPSNRIARNWLLIALPLAAVVAAVLIPALMSGRSSTGLPSAAPQQPLQQPSAASSSELAAKWDHFADRFFWGLDTLARQKSHPHITLQKHHLDLVKTNSVSNPYEGVLTIDSVYIYYDRDDYSNGKAVIHFVPKDDGWRYVTREFTGTKHYEGKETQVSEEDVTFSLILQDIVSKHCVQ